MRIKPEDLVDYPDPIGGETNRDRIDLGVYGLLLNVRTWQGHDGVIEQFAIILDITEEHERYQRCMELKSDDPEATQVRRTDTWHSHIHSHQKFLNRKEEVESHLQLRGGAGFEDSRRAVDGEYRKYNAMYQFNPFEFVQRWEASE